MAALTFKRGMDGFDDCQSYVLAFADNGQGRLNWDAAQASATGCTLLYGWMAGERDYCDAGALGDYLRDNFNLKSMGELHAEDMRMSVCLKKLVEEENYSPKRQLEHVERVAKRVEVDLQEKMFEKDLDWRKEIEKTRWKMVQAHMFHVEEMRLRLVKGEALLEASKSGVDGLAVTATGEVGLDAPESEAMCFPDNDPATGGDADAGGNAILVQAGDGQ